MSTADTISALAIGGGFGAAFCTATVFGYHRLAFICLATLGVYFMADTLWISR